MKLQSPTRNNGKFGALFPRGPFPRGSADHDREDVLFPFPSAPREQRGGLSELSAAPEPLPGSSFTRGHGTVEEIRMTHRETKETEGNVERIPNL